MRLIDADALKKILKYYHSAPHVHIAGSGISTGLEMGIAGCVSILDNAPTVDAVEVVRCKECRSFLEEDGGWCLEMDRSIEINDFCSYGERKDNG